MNYLKMFVKIICAGSLALVILSLFTLLYGYTGVHVANPDKATDYKWEPGQLSTTMKEGFAWKRMDENGFNNSYPVGEGRGIDILLMGSSHMEGANVAADENAGYLLNEMLPELYTYNIGVSGHNIYRCVDNMQDAVEVYEPGEYVLLFTTSIELSEASMQAVIDRTAKPIASYDSGILYFLQKNVPAMKSIYKALQDWSGAAASDDDGTDGEDDVQGASEARDVEEYETTLNRFLALAREGTGTDCKLVIVYAPKTEINYEGVLEDTDDSEWARIFGEACEANDIVFLDLGEDFRRRYEDEHVLARGFSNTRAGRGHLNAAGHEAVAGRVASYIGGTR